MLQNDISYYLLEQICLSEPNMKLEDAMGKVYDFLEYHPFNLIVQLYKDITAEKVYVVYKNDEFSVELFIS